MNKNYSIFLFFVLFVNARAMLEVPEVSSFDKLLADSFEENKLLRTEIKKEDQEFKKTAKKLVSSFSALCSTRIDHLDFYQDLKDENSYFAYKKKFKDLDDKSKCFQDLRSENGRLKEILSAIKGKIVSLQDNLANNELVLEQATSVVFEEKRGKEKGCCKEMARYTMYALLVVAVGTAFCV